MPKQAYLNELSFNGQRVPVDHGRRLFERLFQLLREIDRRSNGITVVGHQRLLELSIGDCSVGAWLRDDRDRRRKLRAIDNRAPFAADMYHPSEEPDAVLEYRHEGREAAGLGLASWHDGLAVSVDLEPWKAVTLRLKRLEVFEDDDGRLVEEAVDVFARNASQNSHLEAHEDWLQARSKDAPRTPDELWLNRGRWFPNIAFTARVEQQIRRLPTNSPAMRQISEKLSALQDALSDWNGVGQPDWRVKVVPEHEGREQYCRFADLDGKERVFELHVRYAPGANRIHFRLDGPGCRIVVAHVGRKLGI